MFRTGILALALGACWQGAPAPTPTPVKPVPPQPPSATAHARQIITAQLAAIQASDHSALAATFAPGAVIMSTDDIESVDEYRGQALEPGGEVARLVADGSPRAIWFDAELTIHGRYGDFPARATELATADAGWKVVAAAITQLRPYQPSQSDRAIERPTAAGPLTHLVLDGAPSPLAVGSLASEIGVGSTDALPIIAAFAQRHPTLGAIVPREVRTADYGFVQMDATIEVGGAHEHVLAQLFAIPTARDGWHVVLVHYLAE
jgi:hypothetical protein